MALSTPTVEQAAQFTRSVEPGHAFLATIMSPSAGGRGVPLMRLDRAEQFLDGHTFEDYQAAGYRLDIHYMDFGALAQWLEEVIGDHELAQAVLAINESGEVFGFMAPKVKGLLGERLDQCKDVLGDGSSEEQSVQDTHASGMASSQGRG